MSYAFGLSRYNGGLWDFHVVTNWYKWVDKGYQHSFTGETPEQSIIAFLNYVKLIKINVKEMMEE
jgi:hypothetical protein